MDKRLLVNLSKAVAMPLLVASVLSIMVRSFIPHNFLITAPMTSVFYIYLTKMRHNTSWRNAIDIAAAEFDKLCEYLSRRR